MLGDHEDVFQGASNVNDSARARAQLNGASDRAIDAQWRRRISDSYRARLAILVPLRRNRDRRDASLVGPCARMRVIDDYARSRGR